MKIGKLGLITGMIFLAAACATANSNDKVQTSTEQIESATSADLKVVKDIPLPEGYVRIRPEENSFAAYLQQLSLSDDKTVYLFNGQKKNNQDAQYAVLKMDIGDKDLQQCADAVMRLRAEYLYEQKKYDKIAFNFTNGFNCDYKRYAAGYRVKVSGNNCSWVKSAAEDYTYPTFRKYMNQVFTYAGTLSLHKQMKTAPLQDIYPGMVFIQTGNPYGHAVTVMDMAVNKSSNDTIFLLSQSYMPAQSIHILNNPEAENSPWYSSKRNSGELRTPEWTFNITDLKQF